MAHCNLHRDGKIEVRNQHFLFLYHRSSLLLLLFPVLSISRSQCKMASFAIIDSTRESAVHPPMAEKSDTTIRDVDEDDHGSTQEAKELFAQKLCMKIDLYVLTPMLFLNFLSLMGRTNIGAALIQKLPQNLKLNAMNGFLAISIPLAPLILFEILSNLIMRFLEKEHNSLI